MQLSRAAPQTMVLSMPRLWPWRCMGRTAVPSLRATYGGRLTTELAQALKFSYTSVAQEIVCDTDTIADLCGTLDRLAAHTAMIICGPSIMRSSNVIRRVQEALGARGVGLFAGVAPHAPVPTLEEA